MKIRLAAILLMTLVYGNIFGQGDMKEGFIVTLKGDTIKGFIDWKEWGVNPDKVLFKLNQEDAGTYYDPFDIKLLSFDNTIFEGGFVDVEYSSRDLNSLSSFPDLILQKDMVFLQSVIKGAKSLYIYRESVEPQFYIKRDSTFELLIYKKYLVKKKTGDVTRKLIAENKTFQNQLADYFGNPHELLKKIKKTTYSKLDIEELFLDYYELVKTDFQFYNPKRNNRFKPGLVTGIAFTSIDYNFTDRNDMGKIASNMIPIGLSVDFPIGIPKWSLYNELGYSGKYTIDRPGEFFNGENYTISSKYTYNFSGKKLVNMLRYKHQLNKFSFYFNAGLSTELIKGKVEKEITTTNLYKTEINTSFIKDKLYEVRLATGISVRYSHFTFETRFEPALFNKYVGSTTSLLLHYTF